MTGPVLRSLLRDGLTRSAVARRKACSCSGLSPTLSRALSIALLSSLPCCLLPSLVKTLYLPLLRGVAGRGGGGGGRGGTGEGGSEGEWTILVQSTLTWYLGYN